MATDKSPFTCPKCGANENSRERRINGNSICDNGHTYPSKDAVAVVEADMLTPERMEYVAGAVAAAWTKNDMNVQARRCKDAAATIRAAAAEIARLRKAAEMPLEPTLEQWRAWIMSAEEQENK